ncbi:MAG: A/G-specific adenine glycosylase [Acidobacteriota bacterium]|nr:A/G-specific adenine glycosylase [Acidobacteriota bacterium]
MTVTRLLLAWFDESRRELPWRESTDFYRVWVSEIMLQQTRVEAVIGYYRRFLELFPDVTALARAPENDVLAAWSGLGYYSRARNLHKAAQAIVAGGGLPATLDEVRALPGVGAYTAAALASISLGLPYAAVDGNVTRVVSRLTNGAAAIRAAAQSLLDTQRPGDFNQAMMELGALVCVPLVPRCGQCPVERHCAARAAGTEGELPVKLRKAAPRQFALNLVRLERENEVFLVRRGAEERRLAGFWELPEKKLFLGLRGRPGGAFSHQIVNDRFQVKVWRARPPAQLPEGSWFGLDRLRDIPLTTIARKAITLQ